MCRATGRIISTDRSFTCTRIQLLVHNMGIRIRNTEVSRQGLSCFLLQTDSVEADAGSFGCVLMMRASRQVKMTGKSLLLWKGNGSHENLLKKTAYTGVCRISYFQASACEKSVAIVTNHVLLLQLSGTRIPQLRHAPTRHSSSSVHQLL